MSDLNNTLFGNGAEDPEVRVADAALIALLRDRTDSAEGDEPLVLRLIRFTGADLEGANLSHVEIVGSVFDSADLSGARFVGAHIEACSFIAAKLPRTVFTNAELSLVNFSHADLEGANFRQATLADIDVRDADLSGSVFDTGASELNFLEAANVQGMDVTAIDDDEMDGVQRVELLKMGAIAHAGFRCPVCVQYFPSDLYASGHQPGCETCHGVGFIGWDPVEAKASRPITCMCCDGTGWISSMTGTGGCLVCDGLGRLSPWGIDLSSVMTRAEDIGNGSRPDPTWYRRLDVQAVEFSGEDFQRGHVENAQFLDCSFMDCDFSHSLLVNLWFHQCDLKGISFLGATLRNVVFRDCQLAGSIWEDAQLISVEAHRCDFEGAIRSSSIAEAMLQVSDDTPRTN